MKKRTVQQLEVQLREKVSQIGDQQVFKKIYDFDDYQISNFGRVKSLEKVIIRKAPFSGIQTPYTYKEKYLKILNTGNDKKWCQIRLVKNKKYKQLSLIKLMLSAFLQISVNDLPRNVYVIDRDSKNINLKNLTLFRTNKCKI